MYRLHLHSLLSAVGGVTACIALSPVQQLMTVLLVMPFLSDVHIDEFQAYALTEPANFFATNLSDALEELAAIQQQQQQLK